MEVITIELFFPGPDPVGEAVRQNLLGNLPKKRKAVMVGRCDTCGIEFNSEDQQSAHMGGKKHAKRMKQAGGECNRRQC